MSDRWLYFSEIKSIEDYENQKKFRPEFSFIKKYVDEYFTILYKQEGRISSKISRFYFENINAQNNSYFNDEETIFEISFEKKKFENLEENSIKNSLEDWNIMSDSDFENEENNDIRNMTKYINLCDEFDSLIDEIDFTDFLFQNVEFKLNSSLLESEEYEKYFNYSLLENLNSLADYKNNLDLINDKKVLIEWKKIKIFLIFFTIIFFIIAFTIIYLLDEFFYNKNNQSI